LKKPKTHDTPQINSTTPRSPPALTAKALARLPNSESAWAPSPAIGSAVVVAPPTTVVVVELVVVVTELVVVVVEPPLVVVVSSSPAVKSITLDSSISDETES